MMLGRVHGRSFGDLTLDLNDLLVFTRVVESRSLTAAAAALGLPTSSVSRRLAQLEERLGVRLVQRTTRRFALTDIGEAYYRRCATIVAEVTAANQLVTDMQATPRGKLRITAPVDMSARYLGKLISRFVAQHPDVNIDLSVTDRSVDLIEEGFDLAVRVGNLRESTLIARRIATVHGILCASPAYLAARGTPVNIGDLEDHEFCVFLPDAMQSFSLTDGVKTYDLPSTPRFSSNHYAPVKDALISGGGIGMLSSYSVTSDLATGKLVRVLPSWSTGSLDVSLVYPARRNVPPRLSLFVDHVLREFDPPPWERRTTVPIHVGLGLVASG